MKPKLKVAIFGILATLAVFVFWPYGAFTDVRSSGPRASYTVVGSSTADLLLQLRTHPILALADSYPDIQDQDVFGYGVWYLPLNGGTSLGQAGTAERPGAMRIASHASNANSGGYFGGSASGLHIQGGEFYEIVFSVDNLTGLTARFGLHDTVTAGSPTDGVWLDIPSTGLITGKTSQSSTASTTGSSFQLTAFTFYRGTIQINPTATRVDFALYNSAGSPLWSDTLTTNIPTGATQWVGTWGICTQLAPGGAAALCDVDWLAVAITERGLVR